MNLSDVSDPVVRTFLEIRCEREQREKRQADRAWAAMALGSTVTVAQALYRGRHVPREALDPEVASWLVSWDGKLTDEIVLDVLVVLEARRASGDAAPPQLPDWVWNRRRAA